MDVENGTACDQAPASPEMVLNLLNALLGVPAHAAVICLIARGRKRWLAVEMLPLNISLCELMLCLRSLLSVLISILPQLWSTKTFLSGFLVVGRFFQCLMCVERFLAVVHPVTFLKLKPLRYRVVFCLLTWMMVVVCSALSAAFVTPCVVHIFKIVYLPQLTLFLSTNLYCCVSVLLVLRRSGPGERKEESHRKRRAFLIILITTLSSLVIYVPSFLLALQNVLSVPLVPELHTVSAACFILGGFVQPLLFIHRLGKVSFCTRTHTHTHTHSTEVKRCKSPM